MDSHTEPILAFLWPPSPGLVLRDNENDYVLILSITYDPLQVMTGPLVLEDLPRLDGMVAAFERVAQDGPDKILREVDSWWPR